ncbi:MAG: PAS domain-containing protein, partial [candidate division NC10 bacterium]
MWSGTHSTIARGPSLSRTACSVGSPGARYTRLADGVVVIDQAGRVVDLNPSAARIVGRPVADAVGRSMAEVLAALGLLDGTGTQTRNEFSMGGGGDARSYEV